MSRPDYWTQACAELSATDPVMGRLIAARADTHPLPRGDPFQTLARSIVGQQISVKAAQSVWDRFAKVAREVSPARVSRMRLSTLAGTGLSGRKAEYIRELAQRFDSGAVDPANWAVLANEAIIAELVEVRGIGRWTAEMFLIFNLLRPDVLPVDDLAVLRAMQKHYPEHLPQTPGGVSPGRPVRLAAAALGERWRPWRTVATWYLWRSLEAVPVDY